MCMLLFMHYSMSYSQLLVTCYMHVVFCQIRLVLALLVLSLARQWTLHSFPSSCSMLPWTPSCMEWCAALFAGPTGGDWGWQWLWSAAVRDADQRRASVSMHCAQHMQIYKWYLYTVSTYSLQTIAFYICGSPELTPVVSTLLLGSAMKLHESCEYSCHVCWLTHYWIPGYNIYRVHNERLMYSCRAQVWTSL